MGEKIESLKIALYCVLIFAASAWISDCMNLDPGPGSGAPVWMDEFPYGH